MATPPLEWSGTSLPRAEESNPAAFKLIQTLEAQWLTSESIRLYQQPFESALHEAWETVSTLTPSLRALLDELPGEYVDRVRSATPFLFSAWMPTGYAAILPVSKPDALAEATQAMMHYGAAVTILDDVADTDIFDEVWGRGVSDTIAEFVAEHGVPASPNILPALPRQARWVVKFANQQLQSFRALVAKMRGAAKLGDEFDSVIQTFLESVRTCRRVRRRIKAGAATPDELQAMADAVPHGMTVVMVSLLGHAQRGAAGSRSTREILEDGETAQRICHYQNALATLEREIAEGDPSNPIVLDAMKRGALDQQRYIEGRLSKDAVLAAVEPSRAALETQLAAMERDFDARASRRAGDDGRFAQRFAFGVRNLHLLYKIAWGQV